MKPKINCYKNYIISRCKISSSTSWYRILWIRKRELDITSITKIKLPPLWDLSNAVFNRVLLNLFHFKREKVHLKINIIHVEGKRVQHKQWGNISLFSLSTFLAATLLITIQYPIALRMELSSRQFCKNWRWC